MDMDNNHIYKINVSGKIYEIKYKILSKIPYFTEFINSDELICFVDRSSMIFDHVLAYVIDSLHPYPPKYFYELDFYGLIYEKDIYKVNMLGKIYHLKKEILMKIPYFVKRIKDINNSSVEIFVDRSPLLFEHVLSYVMDDKYPIDRYSELEFYGITYNRYKTTKTDLCIAKNSIEEQTDKIRSILSDMYDDITKIHTKLDDIKSVDSKKLCKVCDKYVDGEDTIYCYDHGECTRCYNDANRWNNFLCSMHQDY